MEPCKHYLRYSIFFALIACVVACSNQVELLSEIPEVEANEVLATLLDSGIKASKLTGKEGIVSIVVDQSQVAKAITTLRIEGLPRERYAKMGDVFRKEGLI